MDTLNSVLHALPDILTALLAALGGLKVVARYTPWAGDDKVLELVEAPLVWVASLFKNKK